MMEAVKGIFDRLFKILGVGFFQRLIVKPHPSLRFHRRCGKNIKVDETRSLALRCSDYQHGIVFTHRPVEPNEFVCLKIVQTNNRWKGPLSFGFTDVDPALLRTEELERARVVHHRYAGRFWFHGLYDWDCKFIAFTINSNGDVVFRTDNEEETIISHDITRLNPNFPLWAVVDVYGSVSSVQLVHHPMLIQAVYSPELDSSSESDSGDSVSSGEYDSQAIRRSMVPQFFTFDHTVPYPVTGTAIPTSPMPFEMMSPSSPSMFKTPTDGCSSNCVICLDQPVNTAYVDCGHLCICYGCAEKLWEFQNETDIPTCPVCRKRVRSYLRIYN